MSYFDGENYWDYECPACECHWDNDSEPAREGVPFDEDCPECGRTLTITASYSVDYELAEKPGPEAAP